jgi:hypothetical protein
MLLLSLWHIDYRSTLHAAWTTTGITKSNFDQEVLGQIPRFRLRKIDRVSMYFVNSTRKVQHAAFYVFSFVRYHGPKGEDRN